MAQADERLDVERDLPGQPVRVEVGEPAGRAEPGVVDDQIDRSFGVGQTGDDRRYPLAGRQVGSEDLDPR